VTRRPESESDRLCRDDGVSFSSPRLTWDVIRRLRDTTRMKLVLKGIETREDAELCVRHGVDGIIVSNQGGRAEESGRSTVECLPAGVTSLAKLDRHFVLDTRRP